MGLNEAVLDLQGLELEQAIANFLAVVKRRKDIKQLNKILQKFIDIYQQRAGLLEAEVTASRHLNTKLKNDISRWLKVLTTRTAVLTEKIDPGVLGGVIIKFNNTIVDVSLKSQLKRLQSELKREVF